MSDFFNVSGRLKRIRDLKTRAKNRRDLKRYDLAAPLLKQAIEQGKEGYEDPTEASDRPTYASELADCWGILGGVERRWADESKDGVERTEHLRKSIHAYDQGFGFESDDSTYCRLNRLISRLMLAPGRLTANGSSADRDFDDPDWIVKKVSNVRVALGETAAKIRGLATDSVWAAADFALLTTLLGRLDAASAYAPFERMHPPDYACQSALDTVTMLAKVDFPTTPGQRPIGPELEIAKQRLTALLDRVRTS
jgi:hypothetical protein